MRPISAARLNLVGRAKSVLVLKPHRSSDSIWVVCLTHKLNPEPWFRSYVLEEEGFRSVLAQYDVKTTVGIEVAYGEATPISIGQNPTPARFYWIEFPRPIST